MLKLAHIVPPERLPEELKHRVHQHLIKRMSMSEGFRLAQEALLSQDPAKVQSVMNTMHTMNDHIREVVAEERQLTREVLSYGDESAQALRSLLDEPQPTSDIHYS